MRAVVTQMPKHWIEERKNSDAAQWDEMWNGVLHMPPMPNRLHQNIALDLAVYLKTFWIKASGCRVHQEVNVTTPEDEANWTLNYRIPDLVLLDPSRFAIDKNEYMVGAPLVVVEIASPGDETYDKFPFYAGLGVPELWVIHRDTRTPEIHLLGPDRAYSLMPPGPDGWLRSPSTGVEFRQTRTGKLWARIGGNDSTAAELPED
jgi:Uma2 family endonuclease